MKEMPGPGDVLLWRGSHDVLGTKEPVILVGPTSDPEFWVVAELDEQGLPTPYTFAVPVEDLVPENPTRVTPWLLGDPARGALGRVAVSIAAVASFALGALFLIGNQQATQIADGLPAPAAQVSNAPAPGDSPRELRRQPAGSFQAASSLVGIAAEEARATRSTSALALPSAVEATGSGGTNGGGPSGGRADGGGPSGGGADGGGTGTIPPIGSEDTPDARPGNSGSAPGHNSSPGNSGSAPGHNSSPGNSATKNN